MNIDDFSLAAVTGDDPDKTAVEPEATKLMEAIAADLMAKVEQPDQAVAILLLTSVGILGQMVKHEPKKRGKLVNLMTAEYRRLLQRYLPNQG